MLGQWEGWERSGLMVSVDVKHHVHFTWERKSEGSTARTDPEVRGGRGPPPEQPKN